MPTEIVGHARVVTDLMQEVPPVSLFLGMESVGKWTTAMWVRERLGVLDSDFLALRSLDLESAEDVARFVRMAPHGKARLAVVYLGSSGWTAQTALRSALDRLPPTSLVILVADRDDSDIKPSLFARCRVFPFGPLRAHEVAEILTKRGFKESTALQLARVTRGQVQPALRMLNQNEAKITVLGAVRAVLMRDAKTLDSFASRWSEEHTLLLDVLCREAILGRPLVFEADNTEALGRKLALKILTALRHDVRARLVVHAQLMGVLRGD